MGPQSANLTKQKLSDNFKNGPKYFCFRPKPLFFSYTMNQRVPRCAVSEIGDIFSSGKRGEIGERKSMDLFLEIDVAILAVPSAFGVY